MSVIQIPNLGAAIALNGTELMEVVQSGVSVRMSIAQITNFFNIGGIVIGVSPIGGGTVGSYLSVGAGGLLAQSTVQQLMAVITAALPTSNPHVVGLWWLNGEVLSVSQG